MSDTEETALVALQLSTKQTHRDALRFRIAARIDVGMSASQFRNHLANHIIEVKAALDVGQQHGILLLDSLPIHPVHILQIEAITVGTPSLIKNLSPLLRIIHRSHHVGEVNLLVGIETTRRDAVGHVDLAVATREEERPITAHTHRCIAHLALFAAFKVIDLGATAAVPEVLAVAIEVAVVASTHRQLDDTCAKAFGIHLHLSRSFLGLRSLFALSLASSFTTRGSCTDGISRRGCSLLDLRIARKQRRGGILLQHGQIDATHAVVDMVPLQASVVGIEVAVGTEYQIFSILAEGW